MKINKGRVKTALIFLTFIFSSVLIFSALKTIEYNNGLEVSEKELIEKVEKQFDSHVGNIFVKYREFPNEEVINKRDYSDVIKKNKEKEKIKADHQIEYLKDGIKERKKEVSRNDGNTLTKEQIQDKIKELDEEQQQQIAKINEQIDKTDNDYRKEIIEENLKNKRILDEQILNNLYGIKYYIQDNKSKDFDTNSFYNKDDIERKQFSNEGYAVAVYSQNKGKTPIKRYTKASITIPNNYLINTQRYVNENDVTLYLWATNDDDDWLSKLVSSNNNIKSDYNKYKAMALVSAVLFVITLSLLVLRLRKVQVNYDIYNKIPQDLLIVALIITCVVYILESGLFYIFGMLSGYHFYYLNPDILIGGAGILGTVIVTYYEFMREKSVKEVFEKGVLLKKLKNFKYLLQRKDIVSKMSVVFLVICVEIIAICIQIAVGGGVYYFDYSWAIMPIIFIVLNGFLFYLLTKKLIYFNDILDGTKKITSGDLGLVLEEKGKGNLSELAHNINNMKIGLKNSLEKEMKSEKMKSELITNVSHDLKTPLTSIMNYVDLLKKEELTPEKANDYVEILDRKSKRLKVLVEDLFEASKAASGSMELNIEKIEITELVKQTLAELEEKIKASTLDFRVNLGNGKVYAMGDGRKTYRVFANLVQNALKYSMKNSRVYIDLFQEDGVTKFTIKNMSSYEMNFDGDEIAERFKRGDVSRNTEGSGLGLAIAKSIMGLQGGELNIEIDGDLFKAIVIFRE